MFDVIFEALNSIFSPLINMDPTPNNPVLTVLVIAFFISLISTVANKLLVDQDEMNEIQKKSKDFQKRFRDAQKRGDGKELVSLQAEQAEMMKNQSKMMTNSFKPMIVTMVPILLIFWWMRASAISGLVVQMSPSVYYISLTPIWHFFGQFIYGGTPSSAYEIGWLLWYMICTFGMSQILRKYLGFKQGF